MKFSDVLVEVEDGIVYIVISTWHDSTVQGMIALYKTSAMNLSKSHQEKIILKTSNNMYGVNTMLKSLCVS